MTDTPRTRAELLSIFADNSSGGITPQDMRDFVVSVAAVDQSENFSINADIVGFSAASGGDTVVPFQNPSGLPGVNNDHLGIRQTGGSYVSSSYGVTAASGDWYRLPPGLWLCTSALKWDTNTTGSRELYIAAIDDRQSINGLHPFWADPMYVGSLGFYSPGGSSNIVLASNLATAFNAGSQNTTMLVGVSPAMVAASDAQSDSDDGWAVCAVYRQDSGSPRAVSVATFSVLKIGDIV